ncbi:MAG TPA: type IV pilus secretin PilQ [Vicinamibacterales bacterium]|nr:type IV pilus secretin PilQ [Vicinamibacterales bacterium]
MTLFMKARAAHRLLAGCAIAAAVGGSLRLAAASAENVRLVGVSAQASGRTAAVLIESTEPVAYSVSRPDALTVLVDLRNVTVADADNQVSRKGPLAGVTLEQATAIDGKSLARVRVALASPSTYTVRSARNVIRLELAPELAGVSAAEVARLDGTPAATRTPIVPEDPSITPATRLEKVLASNTRTSTTVTLTGNGRLSPASLSESDDQPRRLVLDFPNVASSAAARTGVDSIFVKQVRVALNSRDPLVTRVVMEIAPSAAYHVERTGPDGRDLAVVFEGRKAGGAILIAPPTASDSAADKDQDDTITLAQALANGAALAPRDPITALNGAAVQAPASAPAPAPTPTPAPKASAPKASTSSSAKHPAQPPTPQQPPTPPAQPPSQTPPAQPNPTFSAEVPGSGPRQYVGAPINFDFEDADLRAVLRVFSQFSGLNMIIDPQVQGRVNVLLNDVPWDQALEQILRSNKLGYSVEGNILRIAPLTVLADEQSQTQKLNEAKALAGELQVRTFPLSYAKADALAPLLKTSALSLRGQIQTDMRTNTLILMDLPDRLQTAQALISTLDKPQPQVEVEARVVQTNRDFARAVGIQWGFNGRANSEIGNTTGLAFPNNGSIGGRVSGTQGPVDPRGTNAANNAATAVNFPAAAASSAIGLALGSINGAFNLDVALTALENTGKGRVLSTPRLTTQNNQTAEVAQGVQIPIQTVANNTVAVSFKDATLKLQVTPQITASNTVIMNISIENATPDFANEVNGIPPINTQRALTTVQVNDGATTVIGGIFTSQEQSTNDRTPVLHRVPLLKWLFQRNTLNDSSRELLIFITPRILRG